VLWALPFLISPIYNFPKQEPFHGENLWNPYQDIDSNNWHKGNFQIQALAWGGFTDGSNNPTDSIYALYKKLNYDVIGISDYMKINTYQSDSAAYIAIYEHGYNFRKTHQVSIGATKVFWLDFPFYQTTSQKQFIINQLRKRTKLLSIVHPDFSLEGYSHNDLKFLVNYDLLEALNHQRFSLSHWDAALSNGHAKYILADDDAHDINNPYLVGVVATFLNSKSVHQDDVIEALLSGKTYGYVPYTPDNDNYDKKAQRAKSFPMLKSVDLNDNTITVKVSRKALKIDFIGQGGETKKSVPNTDSCSYSIQQSDTYIRTEVDYGKGEKMYLNPVFRYNTDNPLHEEMVIINWWKSILSWILFWVLTLFILMKIWGKKLT
jgi:lipopolysaccharide export LptBFGC system permease protein LptF